MPERPRVPITIRSAPIRSAVLAIASDGNIGETSASTSSFWAVAFSRHWASCRDAASRMSRSKLSGITSP
jgi:hypothetical protein